MVVGVIVGVLDGNGKLQSNKASNSKVSQGSGGIGGGHNPGCNSSHKSGQVLLQGVLPNKIQGPSKANDKHHLVVS